MHLATRSLVPETDVALQQLLLEHKLLEPNEQMSRPRLKRSSFLDNDGRSKKQRYYEPQKQRMTNTYLEGTEIGAVLARADEEQRQGRSVGDGGCKSMLAIIMISVLSLPIFSLEELSDRVRLGDCPFHVDAWRKWYLVTK
jgi:hypothetical protein